MPRFFILPLQPESHLQILEYRDFKYQASHPPLRIGSFFLKKCYAAGDAKQKTKMNKT